MRGFAGRYTAAGSFLEAKGLAVDLLAGPRGREAIDEMGSKICADTAAGSGLGCDCFR